MIADSVTADYADAGRAGWNVVLVRNSSAPVEPSATNRSNLVVVLVAPEFAHAGEDRLVADATVFSKARKTATKRSPSAAAPPSTVSSEPRNVRTLVRTVANSRLIKN
jgi:hypothetical protein